MKKIEVGKKFGLVMEETAKGKKLFDTEDWIVYTKGGFRTVCEDRWSPKAETIYFKHKRSGMYFNYFLPLFKKINHKKGTNTITGKTITCKANGNCCFTGGNPRITVSPHQDIPREVVAFHEESEEKDKKIPAPLCTWFTFGRQIIEDEAKLCYPDHCEDYKFLDGVKNLTGKALGGIIKKNKGPTASFGVMSNNDSLHYMLNYSDVSGLPAGLGAFVGAYQCPDSFPCPKNRPIAEVERHTQYVFITDPSKRMMEAKVQEILSLGQIPILLGAGVALAAVAASAAVTKYWGWW